MAMDYNIIILLVIVGAAAAALMAYGVARIYGDFNSPGAQGYLNEQVEYMRGVRERNVEYLAWMVRGSMKAPRQESSSQQSYVVGLSSPSSRYIAPGTNCRVLQ